MLLTVLLVVLAATASGLVVYFLTNNEGSAAPPAAAQGPVIHKLADLVPAPIWDTCKESARPRPGSARNGGVPAARECHDLHTRPPRGLHLRERRSRPARTRPSGASTALLLARAGATA
jgi:hypothetical protein